MSDVVALVREAFHEGIHDPCGEAWIETELVIAALTKTDAILIDPTAPETVAALAAAIEQAMPGAAPKGGRWYLQQAAAILPAFVARLRGET